MNLKVIRDVRSNKFTLGTFYVNGTKLGFTCEDTDRILEDDKDSDGNTIDKGEKIYGQTAIPLGTYKVILSFSHHFQKLMPEVLEVPQFTGIRIHGGNAPIDTFGCILLGSVRTQEGTANCKVVNDRLISMLQDAEDRGEVVWLTVE
jgi:Family of unknown function (DUF5675)